MVEATDSPNKGVEDPISTASQKLDLETVKYRVTGTAQIYNNKDR